MWPNGGMATAEPVVRARDLVVRRSGHVVLDALTFNMARGRVTGLLGPSGCGKTTLMRTLVGVQEISSGEVSLLGLSAGHPALRARVGYATQDAAVYPDLTLNENLRYFGTVLGLRRRQLNQAITATIGELDLTGLADRVSARSPAASWPGWAWRSPCSAPRTCWCSTSRPSAWTRCCAATCGRCSTASPTRARPCWYPAT